ncbi:N-6 DNA methylase [Rhodococcus fascians]|nr:N-6 DNA methylase [Rhodococcus fascians]
MKNSLQDHLSTLHEPFDSKRGALPVAGLSSSAAFLWAASRRNTEMLTDLELMTEAWRNRPAPGEHQENLGSLRLLQKNWLETANDQEAEEYVPELLKSLQPRGWDGQFGSTQSIIAAVVAAAAARLPSTDGVLTIFDPAVGTGLLVRGVANALSAKVASIAILGQEINHESAVIATSMLSMGLHRSRIANANSLVVDNFTDRRCELAICDIPHGLRWDEVADKIEECRRTKSWYQEGLPSKSDSSWLFISRMLSKLRAPGDGGGCAVAVVSGRVLFASSDDVVRNAILEQDLVDAVIALPAGLAANTKIPLFLLVLSNSKRASRRGKVQLLDLRSFSTSVRDAVRPAKSLDQDAYAQIANGLGTIKESPISRMVPTGKFFLGRVDIQRSGGTPLWRAEVSESDSANALERWIRARYGPIDVTLSQSTAKLRASIDFDRYFDVRERRTNRALKGRSWPATRLSAVLSAYPSVYELDCYDPPETTILLPLSGGGDALTSPTAGNQERSRRLICVEVDGELILSEFLKDWLNSKAGREAREAAAVAGASGVFIPMIRSNRNDLMRFADSLIIPLPDLSTQAEVAAASARLGAAGSLIEASEEQLWTEPDAISSVLAQIEPLFDNSMARWSAGLPYPIASSLWTLETQKSDIRAAHRQIFLVWEAYVAFVATLLLSAVRQDVEISDALIAKTRIALEGAHQSIEHMGFGGWCVIAQLLSAEYRQRLNTENLAEISQVTSIFAGIGAQTLKKILDREAVALLGEANHKRNQWMGHSGTHSDAELGDQLDYMWLLLERLRGVVGDAWKDVVCVRAGGVRLRRGRYYQQVELVTGDRSPFVKDEREVGQPMEEGELYIISSESAQPLRLESSVVLRSTPGNVKTTCYFYNRVETSGVRLVAFHLSESSELVENGSEIPTVLRALSGEN